MTDRISLVVLPGLDGTGLLLSEFAAVLSEISEVVIVDYPADGLLGYDQLVAHVTERLPRGDFIIIGESFAGPLALMVAAQSPPGLKGVVLGATFARLDLPFKPLLSLAAGISPKHVPMMALEFLLLGQWTNESITNSLREALAMVEPRVLSLRAREALAVDLIEQGKIVRHPTMLLQAKHDRLISSRCAVGIAKVCQSLSVRSINGPHFLLQAAPLECVLAIREFCDELRGGQEQVGYSTASSRT